MHLTDGQMKVELIMQGIKQMCVEIEYGKDYDAFDLRWGYCEFSYEKPYVVLSVLWDSGNVSRFMFSSLSIVKSNA